MLNHRNNHRLIIDILTLTHYKTNTLRDEPKAQWRRQRRKGARSFRSQKMLKPGHPLFKLSPSKHRLPTPFHRQNKTNKAVGYGNIFIFTPLAKQNNTLGYRQGAARAVDLPARSSDLARPGIAPPLLKP